MVIYGSEFKNISFILLNIFPLKFFSQINRLKCFIIYFYAPRVNFPLALQ